MKRARGTETSLCLVVVHPLLDLACFCPLAQRYALELEMVVRLVVHPLGKLHHRLRETRNLRQDKVQGQPLNKMRTLREQLCLRHSLKLPPLGCLKNHLCPGRDHGLMSILIKVPLEERTYLSVMN